MTIKNDNDKKIILVMGITGAGKSYLIREISGDNTVVVGDNLQSCTQNIQNVMCNIDGHDVMILDTPGFDDTTRTDTEVLEEVATYLGDLYSAGFKITGIIYLHNIKENRMRGSSYKNLKMFGKLCGDKSYNNVVMLTGRWGTLTGDELSDAENREQDLKDNFWKMYLTAGCQLERYRDRKDLITVFRKILNKPKVVLDIQHQMIDEKKELGKTAAGEEVNQEVAKEIQKLKAQLHDLAEENQRKSDLQNSVLRAEMEKERKIYQEKLEKLEYDRIVLMEEHKRTEEANSTLMQEFRREQKERDRQREELAQSLENAKLATNEIDRRNARLEAVIKNHNDNIWLKRERKRKGWWYKTRNALGLAKNAHTPQGILE